MKTWKKWQCYFCGHFYDEEVGAPAEGIPAGTRWEDVAEDWTCPECGVGKADFYMMEVEA
jgi:rubredoxin